MSEGSEARAYSLIHGMMDFASTIGGSTEEVNMKQELLIIKYNKCRSQLTDECSKCYSCTNLSKPIKLCKLRRCKHLEKFLEKHPEYECIFKSKFRSK